MADEAIDEVVDEPTASGRGGGGPGLVVAALLVVAVVAACVGLLVSEGGDDGESATPGPIGVGPTYVRSSLTEPEGWAPMAESPLAGRGQAQTAWTGTEVLIWGGDGAFSDAGGGEPGRSDGAAYDPEADTWRMMAESPLPDPENALGASDHASAWTGSELIVWGGPGPEGAAYDPEADSWRSIDPGPLDERTQFASVWTGTELVVIGGSTPLLDQDPEDEEADAAAPDAAAYDPSTDRWRPLPGTELRRVGQAAWTGEEIVFVADARDGRGGSGIALALDPQGGAWRRIADPPLARFDAPPVWTGEELVVVGAEAGATDRRSTDGVALAAAASYDPAQDAWTSIDPPAELGFPMALLPAAVWSGEEVLLVGAPGFGLPGDAPLTGIAFDPDGRTWRALPDPPLSDRGGMASVWTGTELVLWGGAASTGFTSEPAADGTRYRPGPGR